MHLLLDTLFDADGAARVTRDDRGFTGRVVVVGLGNRYRRDDAVGVVAADALNELALNRVRVVTDIVEPVSLLEAWSGAGLAVVIDAAVITPSTPGRVRRCVLSDVVAASEGRVRTALISPALMHWVRRLAECPTRWWYSPSK